MGEGRLGVVDLGGDVLEPGVVGEGVEEQYAGWIAGEGAVGEGVHDSNAHGADATGTAKAQAKANSEELDRQRVVSRTVPIYR